ncbi:hypothetical protein SAZ_31585 [Streptomyces noursei ZPM]|nr:hypothetical protein SAZ_31585 [Streptomyces noursei ZPM]EPY92045.1 hypothetical protein K530_55390 [Streptomyces noursei CCRC 11814]
MDRALTMASSSCLSTRSPSRVVSCPRIATLTQWLLALPVVWAVCLLISR